MLAETDWHERAALTERNRAVVEDFVDLFYRQRAVRLAFERHVVADYAQHNPNIADGREAAVVALEPKFSAPGFNADVKLVLVDGDYAAIHIHARSAPDERGGAVADLYRLADGRIVEHWDVLQPVPERGANDHPMF
jgi:predicted SnoaL-like aldol condensation-catalyzing enzyme